MTRSIARYSTPFVLLTAMILSTVFHAQGQTKTFDLKQVRSAFKAAAGEYFEILGDELAGLESEKRPGAYWLAKVKPKKPGHYAIKFTYKYNDPSYDEGENVLYVRVGGTTCDRQSQPEAGIARFCLGDTVILPVRAANRYDYSFDVKYTYEQPVDFLPKKVGASADPEAAKISNPLGPNLRYLGSKRSEMPQRSVGRSTVIYSAIFEAIKPGRFTIGVWPAPEGMTPGAPAISHGWGTPIIILEPGTPVTYLAGKEDTIDYSDNKRFSSHSGGTFPTNLLLLQPGDIIELPFLTIIEGDDRPSLTASGLLDEGIGVSGRYKPAIHKIPFRLNKDWSYNAFIADYFPADK